MRKTGRLHSKIDRAAATSIEVNDHHAAPTNAVPDREQHARSERGSYRRIDCVAAVLQDFGADLGCQQVLGDHHAGRCGDFCVGVNG